MARIFITNQVFPEKFVPATPDAAGDMVENTFEVDITDPIFAGQLPFQVGDIIEFGQLPADVRAVDYFWDNDALDTNGTPTLAGNMGLLTGVPGTNDATRTLANVVETGGAFGAAAFRRMTNGNFPRIAPVSYDRGIGLVLTAAAATLATTGKLRLHLETKG